MKICYNFFLSVIIISISQLASGQIANYTNDFMEMSGFAASQSLGGANCSMSQGAESAFFNPSAMSLGSRGFDISYMHNRYWNSMATQGMIAGVYQVDSVLAVALTLQRVGVDDLQNTMDLYDANGTLDYSKITYFSVADYAAYLSIGRQLNCIKNLTWGTTVKLIYRHEGDFANAYGFGADLSLTYTKKNFASSLILKDITTTFDFWSVNENAFDSLYLSTNNQIPKNRWEQRAPSIILSTIYNFNYNNFKFSIPLSLRIYFTQYASSIVNSKCFSLEPSVGAQATYFDIVTLRAGISDFQYNSNVTLSHKFSVKPSIGIGLSYMGFRFDYAFVFSGVVGLKSNVFTIGWRH